MIDIEWLKKNDCIIFETISGSRLYGLNTAKSDTDIKGVYILPEKEFYSLDYIPQVNDEKNDVVYYELRRFFELLLKNNPNIMELLNIPDEFVLYKHPLYDLIKPEIFISKLCEETFGKYALSQIKKSKGLNKKIVNPVDKERKTPIDFCYILENEKSISLKTWLKKREWIQENCGLVDIPHGEGIYALFYDEDINYRGVQTGEDANHVATSSVPKGLKPEAYMTFNINSYKSYCKKYKEYWEWVEKRNDERYRSNIENEHNYDAKNIMHTFRLLLMAGDIATKGEIVANRSEREFLLKVKRGEFEYDGLLKKAESKKVEIQNFFKKSKLKGRPSKEDVNSLLAEIRKEFYSLNGSI